MRAIRILVVLTLVCLVFPGMQCKKWRNRQIHKMNITDAKALMIAQSPPSSSTKPHAVSALAAGAGQPVLQKIVQGDNGTYVEVVEFYDENGILIKQTYTPTILKHASQEFIIICFNTGIQAPDMPVSGVSYLVRISDGAVFLIGGAWDGMTDSYAPGSDIQTDAAGNLYYLTIVKADAEIPGIVKIDVADPDNLTLQNITPETDYPKAFFVDSDGVVVFTGNAFRVRKTDGSYQTVPSKYDASKVYANFTTVYQFWTGPDGHIYFIKPEGTCDNASTFDMLTIDSSNNAVFAGDGMPMPASLVHDQPNNNPWDYCPVWAKDLIRAGEYLYYMPYYETASSRADLGELVKFDYTARNVYEVPLPGSSLERTMLSVSDDFLYLSANDAANKRFLVKVNVATDTATEIPLGAVLTELRNEGISDQYLYFSAKDSAEKWLLLRINLLTDVKIQIDLTDYDVSQFFVQTNDTVDFRALRLSDGIEVFGEIDKNGAVKILSEGLASAEIKLIQIQ